MNIEILLNNKIYQISYTKNKKKPKVVSDLQIVDVKPVDDLTFEQRQLILHKLLVMEEE